MIMSEIRHLTRIEQLESYIRNLKIYLEELKQELESAEMELKLERKKENETISN